MSIKYKSTSGTTKKDKDDDKRPSSEDMVSNMFPTSLGMYERFIELRNADPFMDKREMYYLSYNRANWNRDKSCKKKDPNFGQFKAKCDAAQNTFIGVLTERKMFARIIPRYAKSSDRKRISDAISAAFHTYFIKPWEERFNIDVMCIFDMIFSGKGIEHWPNPGCVYTENVPVENVFPDSNAGPLTKHWSYVFIVKDFTIPELERERAKTMEDSVNGKDTDLDFSKSFLDDILDPANTSTYAKSKTGTATDKELYGSVSAANRDYIIPIVYAYVKDGTGEDKRVSLYVFPAQLKDYKSKSPNTTGLAKDPEMRYLCKKKGYCDCISNVVHTRMYQITRSYWKLNSFAQQIYLATMLYDKSTGMILRAAKRSMILYWQSDDKSTQQKLLNQTDDEVQVVDPDTKYITTNQAVNIAPMIEAVRTIMIDTENSQSIAQAPGSQNVKGYAITAEEASIRAQKQGEAEALNIKVLVNNDLALCRELYRRAMEGDSDDIKKALNAFKDELKDQNIDPELYDIKNVYFSPSYITGSSQQSRFANAQATLQALLVQPSTPGQVQAQRDVVAALVGQENVDDYLSLKIEVDPVVIKVGGENEDLDNPYVNPANIPVLPTDKHMQEIPIHIADYEKKLQVAQQIIKVAEQQPNPVNRCILIATAADLIVAQDNKGGHITAHIQAVSNDKTNMENLAPLLEKFGQLQKLQDQLTANVMQIKAEIDKSMIQTDMNNEDVRHAQTMNQIAESHAKNLSDIGQAKAIQQMEASKERSVTAATVDTQKKGTDLAAQEESARLKLQQQQTSNELKAQKEAISVKSAKAKADQSGSSPEVAS